MTTKWLLQKVGKTPPVKNPILIEGLPGIGNVGKIALDYLVETIRAQKIYEIYSNTFPHSVFVTETNLVELPSISVYHKKVGSQDFIFLAGDIQPTEEIASYDFANFVLDFFEKADGRKVITLGGIALNKVPTKPKVYCTGNDRKFIQEMCKETSVSNDLYGIVGPIVGISGLLLGLSTPRKIVACTLLAETLGHPMYLGMEGARELLKVLDTKFKLKVDIKGFDQEIKQMEEEMRKKTQEIDEVHKTTKKSKLRAGTEMSYIG
jgi:uncharacterized protein